MSDSIHAGHREKMRDRFIREKGFENFEDHQILELLLFYANARGDTNPLAHLLLDEFGSLKGVLEARPEQLMAVKGIGKQQAVLISMVVPLTRVWHRCAMTVPDRIGNSRTPQDFRRIFKRSFRLSADGDGNRAKLQCPQRAALPQSSGRNLRPLSGRHFIHSPASETSERRGYPGAGPHYCCGRQDIQYDSARGYRLPDQRKVRYEKNERLAAFRNC